MSFMISKHVSFTDDLVDNLSDKENKPPHTDVDTMPQECVTDDDETSVASVVTHDVKSPSKLRPKPKLKPKAYRKKKDKWLSEILLQQASTKLTIPKAAFHRLVREMTIEFQTDIRYEANAFECLQEASEAFLVQMLEDAQLVCLFSGRRMISKKDIQVALRKKLF
jgi:histone H3